MNERVGMTGGTPAAGVEHIKGIIKRGAVIVVLTTLVVAIAAVVYAKRQPELYEASAQVFLSTQNVSNTGEQVAGDPERILATQAALAQLPEVLERARTLASLPRGTAVPSGVVAPNPSADLLTFTAAGGNARAVARFARAHATAYTEFRRKLDTAAIGQARQEVRRQLSKLQNASPATQQAQGYDNLVQRAQDLRARASLARSSATVGRVTGASQTQPNPRRNGFLGAMMGLMLGVGLAFLRERLNTRVRSTAEIEQALGLPLVGRLPAPPKHLRKSDGVAMLAEPGSHHSEAMRVLATNLELSNADTGASSIMFTSATEGEGKTTTIANLAVALARFGRRVVLVDLDLRRPALDRFFDLQGRPGLTHVLFGRTSLEDALVNFPVTAASGSRNGRPAGSLEVLTCGALPQDPADLLASNALNDVMASLRERGDIMLIDAPPILAVSDAVSISAKVDSVLVVAMLSKVSRPALQELRRVIEMTPVARLGVVVTGTEADEASYSYQYGNARLESVRERLSVG